jgi:hypothetical protein
LSTKVTPDGSAAPPRVRLGAGKPLAVTVKVFTTPSAKAVALALVIAGAWFTVSVNDCGALAPTVFDAVNVSA